VVLHADHGDGVERVVGLALAAAIEAVATRLAAGGFDGGGAAERGEGGVVAQPLGVVAGELSARTEPGFEASAKLSVAQAVMSCWVGSCADTDRSVLAAERAAT